MDKVKTKKGVTTINKKTFGQKASDFLAKWAGSWFFILSFVVLLVVWMLVNVYFLTNEFDPFPFILLNLVLSCLAAIQAPIILMSQNRSAEKDRQKVEYDYAVNRRAEREIERMRKQLSRIERKLSSKK